MFQQRHNTAKQALYEKCMNAEYGELLTYDTLQSVVGYDCQTETGRYIVYAVRKMLEKHASCTLVCQTGGGYRIAQPKEHLGLMQKCHKSAKRKMRHARRIGKATDKSQLTQHERKRHDDYELHVAGVMDMLNKRGNVAPEPEKRVKDTAHQPSSIEDRMKRMEDNVLVLMQNMQPQPGNTWRGATRPGSTQQNKTGRVLSW